MMSYSSPYYSMTCFTLLTPFAVVYSLVSNLIFRHLKLGGGTALPAIAQLPPPDGDEPGRVAIVSGSNTGIGFETAKGLVERGYEVVLACRSSDKAHQAIKKISRKYRIGVHGKAVFVHPLDLSSFDSVREFSSAIKSKYKKVDVLVNNAGRNSTGRSEDGLDLLFQSNFLGHYLLTAGLMDLLIAAAPSSNPPSTTELASNENNKNRKTKAIVVNLSSVMHHFNAGSDLESQDYWKSVADADQQPTNTYSVSKLAALLFSVELNNRYAEKGIRSIAVNPGAVNSDIWRGFPRFMVALFKLVYLNPQQGSQTSLAAIEDQIHISDSAIYVQPYWVPNNNKMRAPFPMFEMLGPYMGYVETQARMPTNVAAAALACWNASQELTRSKWL